MHRQNLHGLGVGLQASAAVLVVVVLRGLGMRSRSQAVSAVAPSCSLVAAACSSWRDVAEICEPALAVDEREHAPRQALFEVIASVNAATPFSRSTRAQSMQAPVHRLPLVVVGVGHLLGRPAEERGQRGRRARRRRTPAARSPRAAAAIRAPARAEDAARAVDHRRDADRLERVAHQRRVAVFVRTSTAMCPGRIGSRAGDCGPGAQQRARCRPRGRGDDVLAARTPRA